MLTQGVDVMRSLFTPVFTLATTTISLSLLIGCVPLEQSSIQQALPTAESVSIDVPAEFKAIGETAEFLPHDAPAVRRPQRRRRLDF